MTDRCLCGDIQCDECGWLQGNYKCAICGQWASECEHVDPDIFAREQRKFEIVQDMLRIVRENRSRAGRHK